MKIRGIDTLEFGLETTNYFEVFKDYLKQFKELKEKGQDTGIPQEIELFSINFTVAKSGAPFYAYRLECKDFFLYFQEKIMKDNSPIRVKFLSTFLWSYGYKEAYTRFLDWFDNFNLHIFNTKVSRVDICADTDEAVFVESDIKGLCTKAKQKTKHFVDDIFYSGRTFSGFTIGRGAPLLARIYNKSLEIKTSNKVWFKELWIKNGWDEEKEVWRVEFQIRKKLLKEFMISSVEDLFQKEDGIWSYLTQNWLVFKSPNGDNVSRWKTKRKWELIQNTNTKVNVAPLIREEVKLDNIERLLDQAASLTLSIGSLGDHDSIDDTLLLLKS